MIKAAGGIVIHPRTGKILLTTKLGETEEDSNKVKEKYIGQTARAIIINLEAEFTKGKLEVGESTLDAALNEIEEEGGVHKGNLQLIKKLGVIYKTKENNKANIQGIITEVKKELTMYLFTILNEEDIFLPTDKRHIAEFFSLEEALSLLKKPEQKKFLEDNKFILQEHIKTIQNKEQKLYNKVV